MNYQREANRSCGGLSYPTEYFSRWRYQPAYVYSERKKYKHGSCYVVCCVAGFVLVMLTVMTYYLRNIKKEQDTKDEEGREHPEKGRTKCRFPEPYLSAIILILCNVGDRYLSFGERHNMGRARDGMDEHYCPIDAYYIWHCMDRRFFLFCFS